MAKFIELTVDGEMSLINTLFIKGIVRGHEYTEIIMHDEVVITVKESYEEVKKLLGIES